MAYIEVSPNSYNVTDINQNIIKITFNSDVQIKDLKLSMDNGSTYIDKISMTNNEAIFSIEGKVNNFYNCKLKALYEEVVTNIPVTGISLNKTSITFTDYTTEQLTATISPANATNKNVNWTSSNDSIVSVNSTGLVTAKTNGSATITATTSDGNYKSSCNISVNKNLNVPVTGISLNFYDLELEEGLTKQLIATVMPANATNKNVRYASSNDSIASVSSTGLITAIKKGYAEISATTESGGYKNIVYVKITEKAIVIPPDGEKNYFEIGNTSLQSDYRCTHITDVADNRVEVTSPNEGGVDGYAIWKLPEIVFGKNYRVTCNTNDNRNFIRIRVDGSNYLTMDKSNVYNFEFTGQDGKSKDIQINLGIRYREAGDTKPIIVNFNNVKITEI